MTRGIRTRLSATEVLAGLGQLDLAGINLKAAKRLTKERGPCSAVQKTDACLRHRLGRQVRAVSRLRSRLPTSKLVTGSCGQTHLRRTVAGIVISEKSRYLPIDVLGYRALPFRADLCALARTIPGTIARTLDNP